MNFSGRPPTGTHLMLNRNNVSIRSRCPQYRHEVPVQDSYDTKGQHYLLARAKCHYGTSHLWRQPTNPCGTIIMVPSKAGVFNIDRDEVQDGFDTMGQHYLFARAKCHYGTSHLCCVNLLKLVIACCQVAVPMLMFWSTELGK